LIADQLQTSGVATIICDAAWNIVWQSKRAGQLFGEPVSTSNVLPKWQNHSPSLNSKVDYPNGLIKFEIATGSHVWAFATCSQVADFCVIQLIDAKEIGEQLAKLSYQESIWRQAIESAGHGVWDYNAKNEALFCSDGWKRIRGFDPDMSVEKDFDEWVSRLHPDDVESCTEHVRRHNEGEVEQFSFEYREKNTNGEYVWIHCCGRVVEWTPDGKASRILGTDIDITRLKLEEQRRVEELELAQRHSEAARQEANQLARRDPLTQLPNRRVFAEEIERLSSQRGTTKRFAVMAIDLDRFKPVNDLYGHTTGDYVLQTATKRLLKAVGKLGIVIRLGGDEFGIIMYPGKSDVATMAKACATTISDTMNEPIKVGDFTIEIGASVGIALFPEHGTDSNTLFRNADMALYAVKQSDRGTSRFYSYDLGYEAEAKAMLENAARHAVANDEILPFFQPIFDLRTGQIQSFEILSRWFSPELGDVAPDRFIPIVDQFNLMPQFTMSILRQACTFAKTWPEHITLAINLTAKEVCDLSTPIRFFNLISEMGFAKKRLTIEVTEQALLKDLFTAKQVINAFRSAGVKVVLDDFGTGYAGLGYLRELKFDGIKIDQSFIANILRQTESATIVQAMQTLADNLGLETVAEGIEDQPTLEVLRKMGCKSGQGYHFAPAVSGDDATRLLKHDTLVFAKTG
jgi:diguanylate cyclase (GGDEF)-like protein/PAS domain S-box-containing protein